MPSETAVAHLESLKEWDTLAYFNTDQVGQAEIFAHTGQFEKAIEILDALLDEFSEKVDYDEDLEFHAIELLHSYLLKASTCTLERRLSGKGMMPG